MGLRKDNSLVHPTGKYQGRSEVSDLRDHCEIKHDSLL